MDTAMKSKLVEVHHRELLAQARQCRGKRVTRDEPRYLPLKHRLALAFGSFALTALVISQTFQ